MIRIVSVLFIFLAWLPTALATPQDARDWSALAQELLAEASQAKAQSANQYDAAPTPPALRIGLQRFGVASSRLEKEMRHHAGAQDLACIFRGMAEETALQLKAIARADTSAEQSDALDRLVHMLDDAVHIGEAAARTMEATERLKSAEDITPGACKAAPFR